MLLETERLIIKKMKEEDEAYRNIIADDSNEFDFCNDDEMFKKISRKAYWTEQGKEDILNAWIFLKDTEMFVGHICIQGIYEKVPELGIRILKEHRNKGIGPESIKAFANWYCKINNINILELCIKKSNSHSIHIFEKLGAVQIGSKCALSEATIAKIMEILPDTNEDELKRKTLFKYQIKIPIK